MMQKERILKSLRINYFISLAATLFIIAAFESGYLYKGTLANVLTPDAVYAVEVVTVMLTIMFIPLAIKGYTRSLKKAHGMSEREFLKLYTKKSLQRIFILFVAVAVSEFVYYGLNYEGAMYCAVLGYGALLYSYPTKQVLEDYIQNLKNNK